MDANKDLLDVPAAAAAADGAPAADAPAADVPAADAPASEEPAVEAGAEPTATLADVVDAAAKDGGISKAEVAGIKAAAAPRKAGARTAAKSPAKSKAASPGARPRRRAAAEDAPAEAKDMVHVVLLTSRFTGKDGKAVARRRVALVEEDRAQGMVDVDHARLASEAEIEAAAGAIAELF